MSYFRRKCLVYQSITFLRSRPLGKKRIKYRFGSLSFRLLAALRGGKIELRIQLALPNISCLRITLTLPYFYICHSPFHLPLISLSHPLFTHYGFLRSVYPHNPAPKETDGEYLASRSQQDKVLSLVFWLARMAPHVSWRETCTSRKDWCPLGLGSTYVLPPISNLFGISSIKRKRV